MVAVIFALMQIGSSLALVLALYYNMKVTKGRQKHINLLFEMQDAMMRHLMDLENRQKEIINYIQQHELQKSMGDLQ